MRDLLAFFVLVNLGIFGIGVHGIGSAVQLVLGI